MTPQCNIPTGLVISFLTINSSSIDLSFTETTVPFSHLAKGDGLPENGLPIKFLSN
ncbi:MULTISPECIES: hypothetical protein [unclassified Flavobacterium]|uniref:hypothetical protein n=1 Tax=unclassified Flavobacterium TaxID=196869 RepID=UPI001356416D|nr:MULTISPECIES: hypothetical protein [unclassified Flavobacterium]